MRRSAFSVPMFVRVPVHVPVHVPGRSNGIEQRSNVSCHRSRNDCRLFQDRSFCDRLHPSHPPLGDRFSLPTVDPNVSLRMTATAIKSPLLSQDRQFAIIPQSGDLIDVDFAADTIDSR